MEARQQDNQYRVIETVKTLADDCTGHAISVALSQVCSRSPSPIEKKGLSLGALGMGGREGGGGGGRLALMMKGGGGGVGGGGVGGGGVGAVPGALGGAGGADGSPPVGRIGSNGRPFSRSAARRRSTLKDIGEENPLRSEDMFNAGEFRRLSMGQVLRNDDAVICSASEYTRENYPADAPAHLDYDLPPRDSNKPSKALRMRAAMDDAAAMTAIHSDDVGGGNRGAGRGSPRGGVVTRSPAGGLGRKTLAPDTGSDSDTDD